MNHADKSPFSQGNGLEIDVGARPCLQGTALSITSPWSRRLELELRFILHYHADTVVRTLRRSNTLLPTLIVLLNVSAQCSILLFSLEL
jgi:hypothetical protein